MEKVSPENKVQGFTNEILKKITALPRARKKEIHQLADYDNATQSLNLLIDYSNNIRIKYEFKWKFTLITTIIHFFLLLLSPAVMLVFLVLNGFTLPVYVCGGVFGISLIRTLAWKPHKKLRAVTFRLDNVNSFFTLLDLLRETIEMIEDKEKRDRHTRDAVTAISNAARKPIAPGCE